MHDIAPLLLGGGLVVAGAAAAAWASARTTLYTVTSQRVLMQYGVALTATLALPMRLIGAVAVSDGCPGDVAIRLKPGQAIGFAKLWPHAPPLAPAPAGADAARPGRCGPGRRAAGRDGGRGAGGGHPCARVGGAAGAGPGAGRRGVLTCPGRHRRPWVKSGRLLRQAVLGAAWGARSYCHAP